MLSQTKSKASSAPDPSVSCAMVTEKKATEAGKNFPAKKPSPTVKLPPDTQKVLDDYNSGLPLPPTEVKKKTDIFVTTLDIARQYESQFKLAQPDGFGVFLRALQFHGTNGGLPDWINQQIALYLGQAECCQKHGSWSTVLGALNKKSWSAKGMEDYLAQYQIIAIICAEMVNAGFPDTRKLYKPVADATGIPVTIVSPLWELFKTENTFETSIERPRAKRNKKKKDDVQGKLEVRQSKKDAERKTELDTKLNDILGNLPAQYSQLLRDLKA